MDAKMVKVIEAIWGLQKRLPVMVENNNSKLIAVLYTALHLMLLAVIMSLVLVRWVALEIAQKINLKLSAEMDLTFSTN